MQKHQLPSANNSNEVQLRLLSETRIKILPAPCHIKVFYFTSINRFPALDPFTSGHSRIRLNFVITFNR